MFIFLIALFLISIVIFLIGLIGFVRSLILKKNRGYGLLGLLGMILTTLIIYFHSEILSYQSEKDFIRKFEQTTQLSFPHSGRMIERKHEEAFNFFGDYATVALIEMDTLDYEKLMEEVQQNKRFQRDTIALKEETTPFHLLKRDIPAYEFINVHQMKDNYDCRLWFHKNKSLLVFVENKN